jgi:hypothetical protein
VTLHTGSDNIARRGPFRSARRLLTRAIGRASSRIAGPRRRTRENTNKFLTPHVYLRAMRQDRNGSNWNIGRDQTEDPYRNMRSRQIGQWANRHREVKDGSPGATTSPRKRTFEVALALRRQRKHTARLRWRCSAGMSAAANGRCHRAQCRASGQGRGPPDDGPCGLILFGAPFRGVRPGRTAGA